MDILLSVFLMGLLGGTHCLGMCGGVVGMLSANIAPQTKQNHAQLARLHLHYNLGRILSYVLMGAVFGLLGTILSQGLQLSVFDQLLRVFSGVLMVLVGLYIGAWSSQIQYLERLGGKLWSKLQPLTQRFMPVSSGKNAFFLGLLWGGIPCGLVYGALSFSMLSGTVLDGAMIMLAFGLGTLPALLLMASMAERLASWVRNPWVRKLSGAVIIALGVSAMWAPVKSLVVDRLISGFDAQQHSQQIIKASDYDYLT